MAGNRRADGELEAAVLAALWGQEKAMSPREVAGVLDDDLAYTTVMTVLTRLWKKELVERERAGRGYTYRALVTEAELGARRMNDTVDSAQDRDSMLAGFVGSLSDDDRRHLRAVLDQLDQS